VLVLEENMRFVAAANSPVDAEALASRRFSVEEVCRVFGVPKVMIADETDGNYGDEVRRFFFSNTIRPWHARIEAAIAAQLLTQPGRERYHVEFDADQLLAADEKARADYASKALGSGGSPAWATQNEIRRREGLNRLDDPRADVLGVGTNPDTSTPNAAG